MPQEKPPPEADKCENCKHYHIEPGIYNFCKRFPKWETKKVNDICGEFTK